MGTPYNYLQLPHGSFRAISLRRNSFDINRDRESRPVGIFGGDQPYHSRCILTLKHGTNDVLLGNQMDY